MSHHPSSSAQENLTSTAKSSLSEDYVMIPSKEVQIAEEELRLLHLSSEERRKVAAIALKDYYDTESKHSVAREKVDNFKIKEIGVLRMELKELEGKKDLEKRIEELEKRNEELEEYKVESEKEKSRVVGVHEKEKEDLRKLIKEQDWRIKELNAVINSKTRKVEEIREEVRKIRNSVDGANSRL